jgi:oligopeptide transport system permease protein
MKKLNINHDVKDLFKKEAEQATPQYEVVDDKDLFTRVEVNSAAVEQISVHKYSYCKSVFKSVIRKPSSIISIIILIAIFTLTVIGPEMFNYDPFAAPVKGDAWLEPSSKHLFGTNQIGRDIWTLVWEGTRLSLKFGFIVAVINTVLGIVIGSIWGFFRKLDPIMLEIRNFINNIPSMLVYMLLLFVLDRSFWTLVFVMCLFGWMGLASFIRNQIIIIQNREYNLASNTLGSKPDKMITHNLLPYLTSVIVTVVSTAIPAAISAEVGLSYFGLGFSAADTVTLGQVLNELASSGQWMEKPWVILCPALVIVGMTVAFFTLGLDLADATDPKNHR